MPTGPPPSRSGPLRIYSVTILPLPRRQRLGPAHNFENPGRDGCLARSVIGQLEGLEQLSRLLLLHRQYPAGLLPPGLHLHLVEAGREARERHIGRNPGGSQIH